MAPDNARFMALAERLADAQFGQTGSNPAVGCVIVKNGMIIGRGATQSGGRPHAETMALAQAGSEAKGATVYVTLEPCAHHGQTPPCAEALIRAGIEKVICPWVDPDSRVGGRGFSMLRQAGIEVEIIRREMGDASRQFFTNQTLKRPFIALKLATSLDGKIALSNGASKWISNAQARRHTRFLRSRFQAIAVGVNTVLADDPALTTRMKDLPNPRPVIFDSQVRTPDKAQIWASKPLIICAKGQSKTERNADFIEMEASENLGDLMPKLLDVGLSSMLIEGGARLAASFIKARLVDRIYHVTTGALMGADALTGLGGLGLNTMDDVPRFSLTQNTRFGDDMLLQFDANYLAEEDFRDHSTRR